MNAKDQLIASLSEALVRGRLEGKSIFAGVSDTGVRIELSMMAMAAAATAASVMGVDTVYVVQQVINSAAVPTASQIGYTVGESENKKPLVFRVVRGLQPFKDSGPVYLVMEEEYQFLQSVELKEETQP